MKSSALFLSLFLLIGSGCGKPAKLEGVYVYDSSQVHERIEIKADGTFVQTIRFSDETNSLTGTWGLSRNEIKFRGFLARYDLYREKLSHPPKEYSLCSGWWDRRLNRIFFDAENEGKFYVTREGGQ